MTNSENIYKKYEELESELEAKDQKIYDLRQLLEMAYKNDISIGLAHQADIKSKDNQIAKLEAKLDSLAQFLEGV